MSWYDLGAGVATAAKQLEKCALSRSTQGSPGVGDEDSGAGICCGESYGDLLRVRDVRGRECESLYLFVFVKDCGRIPSPMVRASSIRVEDPRVRAVSTLNGLNPRFASTFVGVFVHVLGQRMHFKRRAPVLWDASAILCLCDVGDVKAGE
ncbi:uncharacterized protein LOC144147128 [Haemaphysalis longicornis]